MTSSLSQKCQAKLSRNYYCPAELLGPKNHARENKKSEGSSLGPSMPPSPFALWKGNIALPDPMSSTCSTQGWTAVHRTRLRYHVCGNDVNNNKKTFHVLLDG